MRRPVPRITQYASPSLIAAIAGGGHPRAEDPRWRESGAPDRETYAAWCGRWCGMACFRMALLARDGVAPALYELAVGCREYGAYTDEPDRPRGLIYRPFAEYARDKHGLRADVITDLDPAR
ncbi:MAG: peptidase, partial [Streptosporangiaceae bacterium]